MVTIRFRSAAALVAVLLVGFAGESAAWHDHPLDSGELTASRISVVDDAGRCGPSEHVDSGHDALRGTCVACVHGSRPGAVAAPARVVARKRSGQAIRPPALPSPARESLAGREPVRGPPALFSSCLA